MSKSRLANTSLIAFITGIVTVVLLTTPMDCTAQNTPEREQLIGVLDDYESAFHGLSYSKSTASNRTAHKIEVIFNTNKTSRDGMILIREEEGVYHREPGQQGAKWYKSGVFAYAREGWKFSSSLTDKMEAGSAPTMHVDFLESGTKAAVARMGGEGTFEHRTWAEYAAESSVTVSLQEVDGKSYRAMVCDHPVGRSITFYFSVEAEPELRYFAVSTNAGDKHRLGLLHVEPKVVTREERGNSLNGPIEYLTFEGRKLPKSIGYTTTFLDRGNQVENSGLRSYYNYQILEQDLDPLIAFENLRIPGDARDLDREPNAPGPPITSNGEPLVRYELRRGKIVKIADSTAVLAANRAQYYRNGGGWYFRYAVMGMVLLVSTGVLVWYRNRMR